MEEAILSIVIIVVSVAIHEAAHGYAALWLGDPTAKLAGRLSVNPIRHLDPVGSVAVPGILAVLGSQVLFGWAKPVPYNPYNLRNRTWGEPLVAAAGPASNVLLALVFALIYRLDFVASVPGLEAVCVAAVLTNLGLAAFNLMPIPPLDGSKILAAFLGQRGRDFVTGLPFTTTIILVLVAAMYLWPLLEGWVVAAAVVFLGA